VVAAAGGGAAGSSARGALRFAPGGRGGSGGSVAKEADLVRGGKFMGNSWEIHWKFMGNSWEIHWKFMGNSLEMIPGGVLLKVIWPKNMQGK
jgi:hypothetical protein